MGDGGGAIIVFLCFTLLKVRRRVRALKLSFIGHFNIIGENGVCVPHVFMIFWLFLWVPSSHCWICIYIASEWACKCCFCSCWTFQIKLFSILMCWGRKLWVEVCFWGEPMRKIFFIVSSYLHLAPNQWTYVLFFIFCIVRTAPFFFCCNKYLQSRHALINDEFNL